MNVVGISVLLTEDAVGLWRNECPFIWRGRACDWSRARPMGGKVDAPEPPSAVTCIPRCDDVRRMGRDRDLRRRPAARESGEAKPGCDPASPGYKNATRSNIVASGGPPAPSGERNPAARAGAGLPCGVERRDRTDQAVGGMSGATNRNAHRGRISRVENWPGDEEEKCKRKRKEEEK